MTKKYIIKNCPCTYQGYRSNYECDDKNGICENITDCLLKMIVEKCKFLINTFDYDRGANYTAKEILSMLEIEECGE